MNRFVQYIAQISLILLLSAQSFGQRHLFDNITTENGLASNIITDIFQDSKGYMWFSTFDGGVSKYDGINYTNYNTSNGLPYNDVRKVYEDVEGNYWFATHGGGIGKLENEEFTIWGKEEGLQCEFVYDIIQDEDGDIWMATWGGGIIRFDGKDFKQYNDSVGVFKLQISLFIDSKNTLWVGGHGGGGLAYYDKEADKFNYFDESTGYKGNQIWDIEEDKEGNIWFAAHSTGLGKYDGEKFTYTLDEDHYNEIRLLQIELAEGGVWVGKIDNRGLQFWKNGVRKEIGLANGLDNASIWSMLVDPEGILWIGTWGGGVYKLTDDKILHYSKGYGFPDNDVTAMALSKDSTVWVGFDRGGVYAIRDSAYPITGNENLKKGKVSLLAVNEKNDLYVFTWRDAIHRYSENKLEYLEKGRAYITSLEDKDGNFLLGGWLSGSVRYFDGKTSEKILDKYRAADVMGLAKDSDGLHYFATHGGVILFKDSLEVGFMDADSGMADQEPGKIALDEYNRLWVSHSKGGGFSIYDNRTKSWSTLGGKDGLPNDVIKDFDFDSEGDMWVATSSGFCKINVGSDTNEVVLFPDKVALAGKACTHIIYDDTQERILVGCSNGGVYDVPLSSLIPSSLPPRIYLEQLGLNGRSMDLFKGWQEEDTELQIQSLSSYVLTLPYDVNNISVDVITINYSAPEEAMLKWKLDGYDDSWCEPTKLKHINYTNLPSGEYKLEIIAINQNNQESQPIIIEVEIFPPFWETTWFKVLLAVTLIILIALFFRMRTAQLRKKQKALEQKIDEATEEIRHQKDEIEEAHQEITDSIAYAKRIQSAILPPDGYFQEHLPKSFVLYKPKDVVAGDFYWMEEKDGKVLFAAADCTGHGVPGAMVSVICNNGLNRSVREVGLTDPAKILSQARDFVLKEFEKSAEDVKDGMDIALCSLKGRKLEYAGAFNPLWIIRKGADEVEDIRANKQPIGSYELAEPFTTHQVELYEGDTIYIFSDGYADQFGGEKGKKMKGVNFKKLLLSIQDRRMSDQKVLIDEYFENWCEGYEQIDDVCVIGVRV